MKTMSNKVIYCVELTTDENNWNNIKEISTSLRTVVRVIPEENCRFKGHIIVNIDDTIQMSLSL